MSAVQEGVAAVLAEPLKLDIGCGKNKKAGFLGIDQYAFDGVDFVADLRAKIWTIGITSEEVEARLLPRLNKVDDHGRYFFADNSVDEVHCSHFLEHLTNLNDKWERVNFFNELYRVMKVGAVCTLIFPHWCSNRYYGDPTHKEPFSEMGFFYLSREWRLGGTANVPNGNAPHADISVNPNGYSCDFEANWGYGMHPALLTRNAEYQQHALQWSKEAATDIMATLKKKP